jgi:hypothetical protein
VFFSTLPVKRESTPGNTEGFTFNFEKFYFSIYRKFIKIFWSLGTTGNIKQLVSISSFRNQKISLILKDFILRDNFLTSKLELGVRDYSIKTHFKLDKDAGKSIIEISSDARFMDFAEICWKGNRLFSFSEYKIIYQEKDNCNYSLSGAISNMLISSESISPAPVTIKKLQLEQFILFTANEFRILKGSTLTMDGISSYFEFHHCCDESDLLRTCIILFLEGGDFFKDFPFLTVRNLRTIEASGDTAIKLDYMTSFADTSNYYFNAQVIQNTLKIEKIVEFDISYLAGHFVHQINDLPGINRKIILSKANKDFLSIDQIPVYLRYAITIAEDPNFYNHKGIDGYFAGIAIAKNIINRKYLKGASTITMQLAKNLFLTKTKSVARKCEEVVLAWLMENYFKFSKDRILEIYLNIIEFGENIYGLSEAAQYYFEKKVSELDLTESLVLSYIIPRPKYFLEAVLMKSPKLIEKLINHIDFYSNYLLDMKLIDRKQKKGIRYDIQFKPSIGTLVLK